MAKHALIIDQDLCWGCRTCELACQQEYDHKMKFICVKHQGPRIVDGKIEYFHRPTVCHHCENPACMVACPEEAIRKRDDGIVVLDYYKCTGCQLCVKECPYDAVGFDEANQKAFKCNLCHHRVDQGLIPACADNVCLAHCIHFGDPVSIEAEIEKKRQKRRTG